MANESNDAQFMARAISLSIENVTTNRGGPFGAIVVKNNEIIAEGVNLVTAQNDPTAHAEIVAIRHACRRLKNFQLQDCILYTSCEPCPMCFGAIYWARLQSVIYGNSKADAQSIGFDDSFIYQQLMIRHEKRAIVMKQIMREQAYKAFALWQENEKKILY